MKRVQRPIFILVIGLLVAAVPVSAMASEDLLRTNVTRAEAQFDQSLTQAIASGLNATTADQLMWRYSQVAAMKASSWWQAPVVSHSQLDKLNQLQADLQSAYGEDIAASRDAFLRGVHSWSGLLAQGRTAGVAVDDLETGLRFARYGEDARTPNDFRALSQVLAGETTELDGRLAGFHSAQDQASAALQNARALLSSAGQYKQLYLIDFANQLGSAANDLSAVHTAAGFQPVVDRLQQTDIAVQNLLNARSAAFAQTADTQVTLGTAQSIGADLGNHASVVTSLASQVSTAGDQGTFESLTAQLAQQKQALANAIWLKQTPVATANVGVGKVIVISLSRQVLTAYQDGTVMLTSYVATGRPALPTPPGVYHIFVKYSPYKFISPWPTSSPYWYPSAWTSYAMEFLGGGYFIHDAPWRTWYGPGANLYNGTHGCVNVPLSSMRFLYGWAPIGTTVIIQY